MHGDLVIVYKNKQGDRLIDEAIAIGIKGYMRHHPEYSKEGLVAYVCPRLYEELGLDGDDHEILIDSNSLVPYPGVWVCPKESVDVRS